MILNLDGGSSLLYRTLKTRIETLESQVTGKASKDELADYLPLAGGTMTGILFGNYNSTNTTYTTQVEEDTPLMVLRANANTGNLAFYRSAPFTEGGRTLPCASKVRINCRNSAGSWNVLDFFVHDKDADGVGEAYLKGPAPRYANDNSGRYATTAWVNKATTLVHTSGAETIAGVKTFEEVPRVRKWLQILSVPSEAGWTKVATITKTGSALSRYCAELMVSRPYNNMTGRLKIWIYGASTISSAGAWWSYCNGFDPAHFAVTLDTTTSASFWVYQGASRSQTIVKCLEQYQMYGANIFQWVFLDTDERTFATELPTDGTITYSIPASQRVDDLFIRGAAKSEYSNPLYYQNDTNLTVGTLPDSTAVNGIRFGDSNENAVGGLRWRINTDGSGLAYFNITSYLGSDDSNADLRLHAPVGGNPYATAPAPPASASSNEIITAGWANSKFVNVTGDTMTGLLKMNCSEPRIELFNSDYIRGTAPSSTKYWVFGRALDGGSLPKPVMSWEATVLGDDRRVMQYAHVSNDDIWHYPFKIVSNADGTGEYAVCPTPSSATDNSTKIATTSWVHSASCVVHRTGNETIAGIKTFTSPISLLLSTPTISMKSSNYAYSDRVDTSTTVFAMSYSDKNNAFLGGVINRWYADGSHKLYLENMSEKGNTAQLALFMNADGTSYATAPTPPATSVSNEIVTAEWFRNRVTVSMSAPTGGVDGDIWLVPGDVIEGADAGVISMGTEDMTPGVTQMVNGAVYFMYE